MLNKLRCVAPGFYNTILGSQENLMSTNVRNQRYLPQTINLDSRKFKCDGKKLKKCVSVKENIVNFPKKSNNKKSVQMNTFLDRRVNTEVFLKSLEKKR